VLHVHRADRADGLVEALGTLLGQPPADPFAPEVIAVPMRGMERWLTQRLSGRLGATAGRGDGICANVAFPAPRALVGDAVAAACGIEPDRDPWLPEWAVWPLLEVLDGCLAEPWLQMLAAHLEEWVSGWNRDGEDKDLEHQLVLGGVVPFAHLLDQPPRADEHGEGWESAEPTRFGRYARRLWAGLLACEDIEDR